MKSAFALDLWVEAEPDLRRRHELVPLHLHRDGECALHRLLHALGIVCLRQVLEDDCEVAFADPEEDRPDGDDDCQSY